MISAMIFTFSIRDFGHPKFLKSQFGHPVMKILAKSLLQCTLGFAPIIGIDVQTRLTAKIPSGFNPFKVAAINWHELSISRGPGLW